jgi:2-aminoadipate transaminase
LSFEWEAVLARRTPAIKPSVFVDLAEFEAVPGLIFFSGGTPPVDLVPAARLRQAMADAWEEAASIYAYGETEGYRPLREVIAGRMAKRSVPVDPDRLLITNGSQQGLDLIARCLFDPGDVVVIEGPTYFGALQAFDAFEVGYRIAPVDAQGLIPETLEPLLRAEPRPKAIYTVSIFQNPTGATISAERRNTIVELARAYNVVLIEDDPYGELHFGPNPMSPLRALDDNIVYLGTFSKVLMPALRMGWMAVPERLLKLVTDSKEAIDIQSDRFVQRAVASAAADGWLDGHLLEARAIYKERCNWMCAALARELPAGTSWKAPEGGFFLWLELPDGLTADALIPFAARAGVGYLPGSCFYPDRRETSNMRLGFTTLPREQTDEGIRRLGNAVRAALAG